MKSQKPSKGWKESKPAPAQPSNINKPMSAKPAKGNK